MNGNDPRRNPRQNPDRNTNGYQRDPRNPQRDPRNPQRDPRNPQRDPRNPQRDPRNPQRDPRNLQRDPRNQQRDPRNQQRDPRNQQRDPRNPQRRPTPEELHRREMARREAERRRAYEKEMRRRERKRKWQAFCGRFLVFLIIFAVLLAVTGLGFLLRFTATPHADPDSGKIRYYYGGDEVRTGNVEDCLVDGVPFLCFNDLSDYLGMAETGGAYGLKFLFRHADNGGASDSTGTGAEEYVVFPSDAKEAIVNGQRIIIDGMNRLIGDEVWVSTDFISEYMKGLSVVYHEKKLEVHVARILDEKNSTEENKVYLPVEFSLKSVESLEGIPEDSDGESAMYQLNFVNDLSAYEKYMDPSDRDAFLTLVNTTHLLDRSYMPSDLMDCKYTAEGRATQQLRLYVNMALDALMKEMQAAGFYDMAVHSGFRSWSRQSVLFSQYTANEMANNPDLTKEQAEEIVLTYSTRPGTSEHQTGLAVDMDTMGTFSTDFEFTEEYQWLQENAWKFGFILRFPKDKVDITTIQFEPWHYRYVGRYHAKKIHDSGLCLEEYVESLRNQ